MHHFAYAAPPEVGASGWEQCTKYERDEVHLWAWLVTSRPELITVRDTTSMESPQLVLV